LIHGVAFLCGISTPSLSAQGEQRRLAYFNIDRDNANGGSFYIYQYVNRLGFRAILPPNWGRAIGGRDHWVIRNSDNR